MSIPKKPDVEHLLKAVEDLLGEIAVLSFEAPADADYGAIRARSAATTC